MSDLPQVFVDLLHGFSFHFSGSVFPNIFAGSGHVSAVFNVVDVISVRGPSAGVVEEFLLSLNYDPGPPSAGSLPKVVVDEENSISTVEGILELSVGDRFHPVFGHLIFFSCVWVQIGGICSFWRLVLGFVLWEVWVGASVFSFGDSVGRELSIKDVGGGWDA